MKSTQWDRVVTSAALNKEAAVARDGSGDSFTPVGFTPNALCFDELPPILPLPNDPSFMDMTGQKIGRLTVVGYIGNTGTSSGSKWLTRCVCGSYEGFSTSALKRRLRGEIDGMCGHCWYLRDLRSGNKRVPDKKLFANRKEPA